MYIKLNIHTSYYTLMKLNIRKKRVINILSFLDFHVSYIQYFLSSFWSLYIKLRNL